MARRVIGLLALLNDRSCYLLIGRRLIEADRGRNERKSCAAFIY
jgi:hypothetical protein